MVLQVIQGPGQPLHKGRLSFHTIQRPLPANLARQISLCHSDHADVANTLVSLFRIESIATGELRGYIRGSMFQLGSIPNLFCSGDFPSSMDGLLGLLYSGGWRFRYIDPLFEFLNA